MAMLIATTRLAAIEKVANRFRAWEARFGSIAVNSVLIAATVSEGAASERDAMKSLATAAGVQPAPRGWQG
jgi:hypothetical protein